LDKHQRPLMRQITAFRYLSHSQLG